MAVLMIGEVPNLTEEIYGGMIGQMMPLMRASQGFISHAGGPSPAGGWRVVETWESEEDGTDVVRREREAEPSSGHRSGPPVLPTPFGVHEVALLAVADEHYWATRITRRRTTVGATGRTYTAAHRHRQRVSSGRR